MSNHDGLGDIFNRAEAQMGTDMYQAQVDAFKAQTDHCHADAKKTFAEAEAILAEIKHRNNMTNAKTFALAPIAVTAWLSVPAVVIFIYRWVFGG